MTERTLAVTIGVINCHGLQPVDQGQYRGRALAQTIRPDWAKTQINWHSYLQLKPEAIDTRTFLNLLEDLSAAIPEHNSSILQTHF